MKLICGPKGFGKTKIIMGDLNEIAKTAKGNVVFIADKAVSSVGIDFSVRCIYTEEYGISDVATFEGFVKGLMAGNRDIEYLFIDGLLRIVNKPLSEIADVFATLKQLEESTGVNVEFTVSCAIENLPEYIKEYL